MKTPSKFIQSVCFLVLIAFSFSSCKKDEITPTPPAAETPNYPAPPAPFNYMFAADVDGTAFDVQSIGWTDQLIDSIISIGASSDTVGGESDSTRYVGFQVPSTITVGTYTFAGDIKGHYYTGPFNTNNYYSPASGTGTLIISSHDLTTHVIEGTFSFTALPDPGNTNTDSYSISNGVFSIKYLD